MTKKSMINWFTIPCTDFDRAVTFYSNIFANDMIRLKDFMGNDMAVFFDPADGMPGAVSSDPNLSAGGKGPRIYLDANGIIDDVLERIVAAGCDIVQPKTAIPNVGDVAFFRDTESNVVGLHSV